MCYPCNPQTHRGNSTWYPTWPARSISWITVRKQNYFSASYARLNSLRHGNTHIITPLHKGAVRNVIAQQLAITLCTAVVYRNYVRALRILQMWWCRMSLGIFYHHSGNGIWRGSEGWCCHGFQADEPDFSLQTATPPPPPPLYSLVWKALLILC